MQIKEFAAACGVSAHTLRYYEKIGLLPRARRTDGNHRSYDEADLRWIAFVKRLKATRMPLAEIRRYAALREQGAGTEEARMELLIEHARRLEASIAEGQEHLAILREKISLYAELMR